MTLSIFLGFPIPVIPCAPAGLESGKIKDNAITTSSDYSSFYKGAFGRLNLKGTKQHSGGWSARYNNDKQWFKVDLGVSMEIGRVATQGRENKNQWVTSYTLSYSNNGKNFLPYDNRKVTFVLLCREIYI